MQGDSGPQPQDDMGAIQKVRDAVLRLRNLLELMSLERARAEDVSEDEPHEESSS